MKQSWHLIGKTMNTQNYRAHMRIRACIENNQNENECVPGPPVTNALSWNRISEQWIYTYTYTHVKEQNKINNAWQLKQLNQSIIKSPMWGPHQNPFYFAWINLINLIIWELRRLISLLILKYFKRSWRIWKLLTE